jgi:phosphatidylethanolamine-binding protein (PEBP) family uncharacterized protein
MLAGFKRVGGMLHDFSRYLNAGRGSLRVAQFNPWRQSAKFFSHLRQPNTSRLLPATTITKMTLMTISQSLDEAYTKHKIFPEVVDKFDTEGLLTIEYDTKTHVALGNTLKVDETQKVPTIQFTLNLPGLEKELEISAEDKFALVLTDPDAPSNSDHKWSEYAHWIITDLSLKPPQGEVNAESLSTVLDYSKGTTLLPYEGPAPPPGTGKHRYVFLLFKQDPNVKYEAPSGRPTWGTDVPGSGVRDWLKKHKGDHKLIALNFFYAQNPKQD